MIWTISPAYFSDDDLLREFCDLMKRKRNKDSEIDDFYASNIDFLYYRLRTINSELRFRKIALLHEDNSVKLNSFDIDSSAAHPSIQFKMLAEKYGDKKEARISLPKNSQQLWSHHKYSIMARNITLYKSIGKKVSVNDGADAFDDISMLLSSELTKRPKEGMIRNALQHMWGYISDVSDIDNSIINKLSLLEMLHEIQHCVTKSNQEYLYSQTALSELEIWL